MMMSVVLTICAAALVFPLYAWAMWCLNKTEYQRRRLIAACAEAIRSSHYVVDYWSAFDSVSFDRHLWLLTTFRDPWAEYVGLPPSFLAEAA